MKFLLVILFFFYVFAKPIQADEKTRQELIETAKRIAVVENNRKAESRLNQKIREEQPWLRQSGRFNSRGDFIAGDVTFAVVRQIYKVWGRDAKLGVALARSESGLRCDAVGDGGNSIGVFQVNRAHFRRWSRESLFDCQTNVEAGYQIFLTSGPYAWTVYKNKTYLWAM